MSKHQTQQKQQAQKDPKEQKSTGLKVATHLSSMQYLPWLLMRGFKLSLSGDSFEVIPTPTAKITPELRKNIVAHRDDLLAETYLYYTHPEEKILMWLAYRGWVRIKSKLLNDTILIIRDDVDIYTLPEHCKNIVTYTLSELKMIIPGDPDGLRTIHYAKREGGGRVIPEDGWILERLAG
jgi:hypothetical protein